MHFITGLLKISTLSVALLASAAVVATVTLPGAAYAGSDKSNGKGNGNSGDKGNSGKSAGSSDKGNSGKSRASRGQSGGKQKSTARQTSKNPIKALGDLFKKKEDAPKVKRVAKTKSVTKVAKAPAGATAPKPRGNKLARTLGVHPSELGALNAANASPNALANASPNSRVGLLALYAQEVEATRALEAERAEAQAILDALEAPERGSAEIDLALTETDAEKAARLDELDDLLAALEEAGGTDEAIEGDIASVTDDIVELDEQISALEQEREDNAAYEAAEEDLASLDDALANQSDTQRAALEAAANKEVTDEVEDAVQSLLGLNQETTPEDDILLEVDVTALD